MLLCGIHDGHNSAAAIVRDGELLMGMQEERPSRVKNFHGFPEQSIQRMLDRLGAKWTDVDRYIFSGREYYLPPGRGGAEAGHRQAQTLAYKNNTTAKARLRALLRRTPLRAWAHKNRWPQRIAGLVSRGVSGKRIGFMEHHGCHAAAAYYGPGVDEGALVLTLDGAGDGLCATVAVPEAGRLKRIGSVAEEHSIGILWNIITSLMGMVPNEHEYKMMGMAPYAGGKRVEAVRDIFASAYHEHDGGWSRTNGLPDANYAYDYWKERLEMVRFDYVMAGLQMFTEQIVARWVRHWVKATGRSHLRLAGGVFMNVKVNQVLCAIPEVTDVYVFPSCGDETNTIGSCWSYLESIGKANTIKPMGAFYLGLEPPTESYRVAADAARAKGYAVSEPADIEDAVATLLASGEVVARVNGREEFGARALGNRSIMADPSRRDVVRLINRAIKSRDFWMPFAASVLDEAQDEYLVNPKRIRAPYMILTFPSKNADQIAAGTHPEDGTVRPQIVTAEWNPSYHRLIKKFREKTGRGAILNTSFNLHGEPIASMPGDAIDVMDRSGLNHLQLGPFLISKPPTMHTKA